MAGSVQIDPPRLARALKWAGLAKVKKPLIDPVVIEFASDGAYVRQTDSAEVVGVIIRFGKNYFTSYDSIGKVTFPAALILDRMSKIFKKEKTIVIEATENELVLKSANEVLKMTMPAEVGVNLIESEIKSTDIGIMPAEMKPKATFEVVADDLAVGDAEKVKFTYDTDGMKIVIEEAGISYTKKLAANKVKATGKGEVIIDGDTLARIVKNISGAVLVSFTDGPLLISANSEEANITYLVVPQIE